MAININATFNSFVDFAMQKTDAGKGKAIARVSGEANVNDAGPLQGRTIKAAKGDWVGIGIGRLKSLKNANNVARDLFRKAVSDMFGGEDHIPESVRNAMKMEDYGKGKPLTARRIMAVNAAVEAELKKNVAEMTRGCTKSELAAIDKAADIYSREMGVSKPMALNEVAKPGTKANRLLNYDGRFLESDANFRNGMRLLDTFETWFKDVRAELEKKPEERNYEGMGKTLHSGDLSCFSEKSRLGFEKFLFESIAHDPAFNLKETDAHRLFGMENNVATHFIGRNLHQACAQSVAQIPFEKRNTFYKAVTMFFPIVNNADEAKKTPRERGEPYDTKFVVARVLRNLEKISELEANGNLTFKNLAKLCVPELPEDSEFGFREVGDALTKAVDDVSTVLLKKFNGQPSVEYANILGTTLNIMQETGCTMEEAIESAETGKSIPLPPYQASGTLNMDAFDGTTREARRQLSSDLVRPYGYFDSKTDQSLSNANLPFTFNLPGEEPITTDAKDKTAEGQKKIDALLDKIEALCGKVHPAQASSVMTIVSQSGLGTLRGGLTTYGIQSNEHSPCDFTLSKDAETGDVTIKYSSPEGLPFKFEWTATVRNDGYVSTTPMKFAQPASLPNELKTAALDAGYSQAELPKLANATKFYAEAKGISEAEAFKEVSTPGTNANRLMNYGGRFLEYKEDFADGLRLMDSFSKWFGETGAELAEIHKDTFRPEYKEGQSKTIYNAKAPLFAARCKPSMERFTFEYFAHDPSVNLSETDPEKLFGIENNPAISTIGRNFSFSRTQTFAQVPPEKRTTLFKALNVLSPLYASNLKEANEPPSTRNALKASDLDVPVARILKNLDKVAELEAKGQLTSANLVKLCFPEIPEPGENPEIDVMNFLEKVNSDINEGSYPVEYTVAMGEAMNSTGCSVEEAFQIAKGEKQIANVPYFSSGTMEIHQLGDLNASRSQLAGDLSRADNNYGFKGSPLTLKNPGFRFNFPGESIVAGKTAEGKANIPKITDKLESLCGKAHPQQAASLLMMASQSGLGIMKGGLMVYGVSSDEHSSMDFTISKNEETGDITIRYSAPEELPFHLEWTATIDVNGNVSTTPVVFNPEK